MSGRKNRATARFCVSRLIHPRRQACLGYLGTPWATPHVSRHSLPTELRDRGYEADVIAKVLGHTDEAFTRRVYIHTKDIPRFDDIDMPVVQAVGG